MAVKLAKSPEPSKAKRSTKPDAASAPSAPPVEAPVPQPAPAPAATHRPAVPTISPLSGAGLSAGEINRLRLIELHRALLSELDELNGGLDRAFESIRAELQEKAAELRRHLGCSIEEDTAPDEPWALHLSAQIEKLAQRLVIFRTASKPDADDLAALSTRLKKAARKLQR
jgi:hypothetical protein